MPLPLWPEPKLFCLYMRVDWAGRSAAALDEPLRLKNLTGGSAVGAMVLGSAGSWGGEALGAAATCFLALMELIWPLKQATIFLQGVQNEQSIGAQTWEAKMPVPTQTCLRKLRGLLKLMVSWASPLHLHASVLNDMAALLLKTQAYTSMSNTTRLAMPMMGK